MYYPKHVVKISIALISLLIFLSCQPDKQATKVEPNNPSDTSKLVHEEQLAPDVSADNDEDEERAYWQKPNLVLSKLGPLENKTIADIGAGMGYFSFELAKRKAKKVIAIDIDKDMLKALNYFKNLMEEKEKNFGERFEVRLAQTDDSNLKENEVDIILIVNTVAYIENRIDYLTQLRNTIKDDGQIIIVDYKTKKLPEYINAPSYEDRIYLHVIEEQLEAAGFTNITSDDTTLDYQFIVIAQK